MVLDTPLGPWITKTLYMQQSYYFDTALKNVISTTGPALQIHSKLPGRSTLYTTLQQYLNDSPTTAVRINVFELGQYLRSAQETENREEDVEHTMGTFSQHIQQQPAHIR
eukprot:7158374-Ditylum_brightwellii.AAC.1